MFEGEYPTDAPPGRAERVVSRLVRTGVHGAPGEQGESYVVAGCRAEQGLHHRDGKQVGAVPVPFQRGGVVRGLRRGQRAEEHDLPRAGVSTAPPPDHLGECLDTAGRGGRRRQYLAGGAPARQLPGQFGGECVVTEHQHLPTRSAPF